MGGRLGKGLLVGVLTLLAAPGANAAVRCVTPAAGPDCASTFATIPLAVSHPDTEDGDTIRLAAGIYLQAQGVETSKRLDFVGVGAGSPDVMPDPASETIVLTGIAGAGLTGPTGLRLTGGGSVTGMRVFGGQGGDGFGPGDGGPAGAGIVLLNPGLQSQSHSLSDVVAVGGLAGQGGPGGIDGADAPGLVVSGQDGPLALASSGDSYRSRHNDGSSSSPAIFLQGVETRASFSEVDARSDGPTGPGMLSVAASTTVRRSRLSGGVAGYGLHLSSTSSGPAVRATEVIDSLVMGGGQAVQVSPGMDQSSTLDATGSTFVARASGADAALGANSNGSTAARINLRNSVARVEESTEPNAVELRADGVGAEITAVNSAFSTRRAEDGGVAPDPGSGTNLSGDPLFVAPGSNYALQAASPLIDRGDPALVTAGQLDLSGNPRSLDGNRDCGVAPDIGAFELAGNEGACGAANVAPVVTGFGVSPKGFAPRGLRANQRRKRRKVKRGTTFRYTLSEAAEVAITVERQLPGRRVKGKCRKPTRKNRKARRCKRFKRAGVLRSSEGAGRQSTAFSGRFRGNALKPGRYRARLVATDPGGLSSAERRVSFRVVKP